MSDQTETLRDTITAAFEEHVPEVPAGTDPGQVVDGTIPPPEAEKPGRTAGRPRDEKGKLLPGKPADNKGFVQQKEPEGTVAAVPQPAEPAIPRPSSWRKDMWPVWDKLNQGTPLNAQEQRQLAKYNVERENDFAKGVSTYKNEWDQVKPIAEAMQQFLPELQKNNIKPEQWISNLGNAHRMLATGAPEAKASMFLKLAKDYGVPIESLFVQGQDGRLYANPSIQPHQQQQAPQPDVTQTVRQILLEEKVSQELHDFATTTDDKGNLKHPHFPILKQTMQGLLQAELAQDINEAYDIALKHPRHADIYAQVQEQEQRVELERKAAEQAKVVTRARTNAVSVKGSTPTAPAGNSQKSRRETIADAFDQHSEGGRL